MQVKQALYAFDFDQTYDLLWVDGLSFRNPLIFVSGYLFDLDLGYMPIALIERYTPDNLPWANEWVDINYEFLKIMSRTHLLDNSDLMGLSGNLEPAMLWNASNPQWQLQIPRISASITVQKTSDNPVSLTWLELAFTGISGRYGDRSIAYDKKCQIYNKKHLILEDNNPRTIFTFNLLRNSLVISEPDAVTITAPGDSLDATLYSKLENQLELILQQLGLTEPRIVTYVDLKINYELDFRDWRQLNQALGRGQPVLGKSYLNSKIDIPIAENPVYTNVPEWYHFASLIRANNNPWGELENLQDKGKPVSCLWDNENQTLDFKIWNLDYIPFGESLRLIKPPLANIRTDDAFYFDWDQNFPIQGESFISSKIINWTFSDTNVDRFAPSNRYWFTVFATQNNNYSYRSNANREFLFEESFYNQIVPVYPFLPYAGTLDLRWFMVREQSIDFTMPALGGYFGLNDFLKTYLVSSYTGFLFHPYIIRESVPATIPENTQNASGFAEQIYSVRTNYTVGVINENVNNEIRATRIINSNSDSTYWGQSLTPADTTRTAHDFTFIESDFVTIPISLSIWDNEPLGKHQLTDLQAKAIIDTLVMTNYSNFFGFEDPEQYWEIIVMPDSTRIKEIHAALEAGTYSVDSNGGSRVANLGYYIERIARVLGISVNPNGSIRSIRQSKFVEAGKDLPAGWPIGQWGRNEGGDPQGQPGGRPQEERDGLAYEVRSNRVTVNPFTGVADKIDLGGYVLVENLPQLLHVLLDDLDKGLGWQEAGSNIIPDANNQGRFAAYEGMNSLLVEVAYMLSDLSRNIKGNHISSLITQATLYEVLGALGLPINFKSLKVEAEGNKEIHYPALDTGAPTLADLFFLLALNLSPLVGGKINMYPKDEEK